MRFAFSQLSRLPPGGVKWPSQSPSGGSLAKKRLPGGGGPPGGAEVVSAVRFFFFLLSGATSEGALELPHFWVIRIRRSSFRLCAVRVRSGPVF